MLNPFWSQDAVSSGHKVMHDILKYDGDEREGCCSAGKGSAAGYGIYIHPLVILVVQGKLHQGGQGGHLFMLLFVLWWLMLAFS